MAMNHLLGDARPLVARSRSLSAIYLPPYTDPPTEVPHATPAVVVSSDHLPLVKITSHGLDAPGHADRLVLVAHESPDRPLADRETVDPYLFQMAHALRCGFRRGIFPPELYLESLAGPLTEHLRNYYRHTRERESGGLSEARLARALAFIEGHLGEPLSLAALADATNLSRFHFGRMFKRSMGMSPAAFIVRRRLDVAADLLVGTSLPIAEVSRRVGFQTQAHFCTAFKRAKGVTPSRHRNTLRAGRPSH